MVRRQGRPVAQNYEGMITSVKAALAVALKKKRRLVPWHGAIERMQHETSQNRRAPSGHDVIMPLH